MNYEASSLVIIMMGLLNIVLGDVGAQAFKTEYLWKARAG